MPIWLLLTVLLSVAAAAVSRRRRARELEMLDRDLASLIARCGSTRAASALLAQMEFAQRMLAAALRRPLELDDGQVVLQWLWGDAFHVVL